MIDKIIGTSKNNVIFANIDMTDNKFVCNFTKYEPITPEWIDNEFQIKFEWLDYADRYVLCERYHSAPQDLIHNMPDETKIEIVEGVEKNVKKYICDGNVYYLIDVTAYKSFVPDHMDEVAINKKALEDLINFDRKYDRKDKAFPKCQKKAYEEIVSELEKIDNEEVIRKMIKENIINPSK